MKNLFSIFCVIITLCILIYGIVEGVKLIADWIHPEPECFLDTNDSKYINECDSLQQQQVVSLSLLNFTIGDSILKSDLKSSKDRLIKGLKTSNIELKTIYNFDSQMAINEKKYDIKCTLITYMEKIAWIEVYLNQNVYNDLIRLYEIKYGKCVYNRWQYKNQTIDIDFCFNDNATEFERTNYNAYYSSKNKYLIIKYFDHKLQNEVEKFEREYNHLQYISDSISSVKKMEIQKQKELKIKTEKEGRISKEIKQI